MAEQHPSHFLARLVRALRGLRFVKGWERISSTVPREGGFRIKNDGIWFSGNLSSFIDRHIYLFGGYERGLIAAFIAAVGANRRSVCLDVGANVGNHSLRFSQAFETVYAFEPNPAVLEQLRTNLSLNPSSKIKLEAYGLSDVAMLLDFYDIDGENRGLGTFSIIDQYDKPLSRICQSEVRVGDDFVEAEGILRVDAIKIDVQGFEPNVLRGLRRTLERDRPVVWLEVGAGTQESMATSTELAALFPYPVVIKSLVLSQTIDTENLPTGNYLVLPAPTS